MAKASPPQAKSSAGSAAMMARHHYWCGACGTTVQPYMTRCPGCGRTLDALPPDLGGAIERWRRGRAAEVAAGLAEDTADE